MLHSCLSWLLEWPECQHSVGLSKLVSVMGIRKNHKVTNLENLAHATIQCTDNNSLMENAVCGRALLCRWNHFAAAHNSGH